MLRKALTLGMVFILALSLLAVSMITCFTYDAEAIMGADKYDVVDIRPGHGHYKCKVDGVWEFSLHAHAPGGEDCSWYTQ